MWGMYALKITHVGHVRVEDGLVGSGFFIGGWCNTHNSFEYVVEAADAVKSRQGGDVGQFIVGGKQKPTGVIDFLLGDIVD